MADIRPDSTWRVAVASRSFSRNPVLRAELLARYPNATFNDEGRSLSGPSLVQFLDGHDMAITALEKIDESVVSALPDLRILSKYGVGIDMIDLPALHRHGVRFGWKGGVNRRSVSELVIGAAIALFRHLPQGDRLVRSGGWQQLIGRQLTGKTVGIIGLGHVGKDLAGLLAAFDCPILAHDILRFDDFCAPRAIEQVSLDDLIRRSDVVTVHVPLDDSTLGMIGADQLAKFKPGALLINAARGGIVDEQALKVALKEKLGGAALDVYAQEPPVDEELLSLNNLLLSPHIGGSAEEAILAMGRAAIDGLESSQNALPENFR